MYLVYLLSAASPLSKSVGRTKVSAETSVGRLSVGIFADMSAVSAESVGKFADTSCVELFQRGL